MDMFDEEHEEDYWQQRRIALSNDRERTAILYVEPIQERKTPLEHNRTVFQKIEPTERDLVF